MPLTLLLGPANCGKVATLLDRFAEQVDAGASPTLVVPTRPDVDLAERDLLARRPALLGGAIGTFDDLFERVLERAGEPTGTLSPPARRVVLEQVIRDAPIDVLAAPARFPGFVDGLARVLDDIVTAAPPEELARRLAAFGADGRRGELAGLHRLYRDRLAELGIRDRAGSHAHAAGLLETRLDAWDGAPVFAYGFEDMSGIQLAALRAIAARAPVMVSLPYQPGRPALAAVRPAVDALTAVPHEVDAAVGLGETALGQALLGVLRFSWFGGDRPELFRFLRSPFAGIPRATVDYAEGRLRGRGALRNEDVRTVLEELEYSRLL